MLLQKELFDIIERKGLTPSQYYALLCVHTGKQSKTVDTKKILRTLPSHWVIVTIGEDYILTTRAKKLIREVEKIFTDKSTNAAASVIGEDYEARLLEYLHTFPAIKLGSGKYARTTVNNLKAAFKWFFKNYDYDWDTVIAATELYVETFARNNYKFMRTSQYFIRKQEPDKSYISELAEYCETILNGDYEDIGSVKFSSNVV